MSEPEPKNYGVTDYETWSTEALLEHSIWLSDQDAAGEGDYYDDLGKIAAVLNERERR